MRRRALTIFIRDLTSERKYLRWLHLGRHPLTRIVRQVECLDVTFRSEAVRWIHFPDRMALKGAELTIRTVDLLIDPRRGVLVHVDYNKQTLKFLEALDQL